MEKTKNKLHDICEIKEKLIDAAKAELARGIDCVNTHEMGAVIDMIKDLAKAEKDCYEACFYKEVVETMDDFEDKEEAREWCMQLFSGRPGYDHYRYSSGRFAPKGRGHYSGYRMPEDPSRVYMDGDRMGMPYGESYGRYMDARRHYHESHSKEDKERMDRAATEHLEEAVETMKDIWEQADPEMKRRMKADISKLSSEMM